MNPPPLSYRVFCPLCDAGIACSDRHLGKRIRCPKCEKEFRVPKIAKTPAPQTGPEPPPVERSNVVAPPIEGASPPPVTGPSRPKSSANARFQNSQHPVKQKWLQLPSHPVKAFMLLTTLVWAIVSGLVFFGFTADRYLGASSGLSSAQMIYPAIWSGLFHAGLVTLLYFVVMVVSFVIYQTTKPEVSRR